MSLLSAIPNQIVLQTGNAQVFLLWDIVSGATSYSVQRSTDGVTFTVVASPVSNSYLDTAVTVGTAYYYKVASVSAGGTSPYGVSSPENIVPCLPGQINLGYIRYLSQLRADKLNSQFLTTDEWNSNINQSVYELYDILVTKFGDDYFMAPPFIFQTTGAEYYTLPDGSANFHSLNTPGVTAPAMYKLIGVDCSASIAGNAWVTLPRFNWIDRNKFVYPQLQANAIGLFNLSYRQMGNTLQFIPRPAGNQFLQMWYVPIMTQLLQDTDMLSFSISGWSELVILGAAIKALLKEESFDQANALQGLYNTQVERVNTQAANRDVGQPNTVSNTRGITDGSGWGFDGGNGGMGGW